MSEALFNNAEEDGDGALLLNGGFLRVSLELLLPTSFGFVFWGWVGVTSPFTGLHRAVPEVSES